VERLTHNAWPAITSSAQNVAACIEPLSLARGTIVVCRGSCADPLTMSASSRSRQVQDMRGSDDEAFPPAPWQLRGEAVFGMKLAPKALAQSFAPADVEIVCVYPGHTLAMLYLARYSDSPVGEYRELIIAPALIRRGGWIGFWISYIVVDDDRSIAAGRAIWSLPKERAVFRWRSTPTTRIDVEGPVLSADVAFEPPERALRLPFLGAVLNPLNGFSRWFVVRGSGRVGVARARLQQSNDSQAAALGFIGTQKLYVCSGMHISIGAPRHIADRAAA
jgi:hypothetical protein